MRVVDVIDRSRHTLGIIVQVVIELFAAHGKGVDLLATVNGLAVARNLARHGEVNKGVDVHLGMHAKVGEIALGDARTDGGGHRSDAKLQARAIRDHRNDELGDSLIDLGGRTPATKGAHRWVLALDDHVYTGNADM